MSIDSEVEGQSLRVTGSHWQAASGSHRSTPVAESVAAGGGRGKRATVAVEVEAALVFLLAWDGASLHTRFALE